MRLLMIFGGLLGFLIGICFGIAQSSTWPSVIWRASVAAYLGGLLLRWWGRVWARSLAEANHLRGTTLSAETQASSKGKI